MTDVTDEAALFTGDLLSTGYWGASLGEIREGDTVAVIGAGPTGWYSRPAAWTAATAARLWN